MAKGMIDEIRAAEAEAERIVADAENRAKQGRKATELKAEELLKKTVADAHEKADSMISTAENNAYKLKTKAAADNEAEAEKFIESMKQKREFAVKAIVNDII